VEGIYKSLPEEMKAADERGIICPRKKQEIAQDLLVGKCGECYFKILNHSALKRTKEPFLTQESPDC